jgi:hypothetical protein
MDESTLADVPTPGVDYEAEVDRYIGEMRRIQRQLSDGQRNIDRLSEETRLLLAETHTLLDRMAAG